MLSCSLLCTGGKWARCVFVLLCCCHIHLQILFGVCGAGQHLLVPQHHCATEYQDLDATAVNGSWPGSACQAGNVGCVSDFCADVCMCYWHHSMVWEGQAPPGDGDAYIPAGELCITLQSYNSVQKCQCAGWLQPQSTREVDTRRNSPCRAFWSLQCNSSSLHVPCMFQMNWHAREGHYTVGQVLYVSRVASLPACGLHDCLKTKLHIYADVSEPHGHFCAVKKWDQIR